MPLLKMFLDILHCFPEWSHSHYCIFVLMGFVSYDLLTYSLFIWPIHFFFFKLTLNICFNLSHLCLENFLWSPVCEIMCTNCYWYLKFKVNIHVYNVANYQFELFCNWTFLISCCQRARCVRVWILLWILQMCDHIKVHVHIKFQTSNR